MTATLQPTLLVMLAAVGLILLLASVNLGTLVLSRSIERAREIAVRTALGASRARLVRQLVTEQAVLASAGAVAGLALAQAALPLLVTRIPPEMPRQGEIALDGVVFAVVLVATVGIALLFALVPILLIARPELQPLLRQQHSTTSGRRRHALGTLVAVQIGLAVVLGIGAGLMLRSLWNLFAGVGLLVTVVGVYGVVAYSVRRREREFGIRLALGAPARSVVGGVIRQGASYATVGIALALPAALGLTRFMGSVIYGISARDPLTFMGLPLAILGATLAASYFPARRAAQVGPATTMRSE